MEKQVRGSEKETTAATAMAEMQRQCGNSGSSKVADQDKQVESTMNINECASCTTPTRHKRYTGTIVALQWRSAGEVGRMEMNV